MTDYDRVHRELNKYIPDISKMTRKERIETILDSFFNGQTKYRHASTKLADGYQRVEGGQKIWVFKDRWKNLRHVIRDAKGRFKEYID